MAHRIAGIAAAAFALAGGLVATAAAQSPPSGNELPTTAREAAAMVREGKVSAADLMADALGKAEDGKALNAFITRDDAGASAGAAAQDEARTGALAGVPIVVKDNIIAAGIPTTAGTPGLQGFVPQENAPVLQRLLDEGAVLVGKTNMHELAFGITSNNAAFGAVGNAVAPDRFAGGSSGGTAAAIASGMALAGLGTDTGGSVRIPAALNGIAGLRPTVGRYPAEGLVPISATRDTAGPMTTTVDDVVLLDAVITGEDPELAPADLATVRLGLARPLADGLSEGVSARFSEALEKLEAAGATIVEVDLGPILAENEAASFPIALYEIKRDLAAFLARYAPDTTIEDVAAGIVSPDVKGVFDTAVLGEQAIPEEAYKGATEEARPQMQRLYDALFAEHDLDAIVFPTTPLEAQPIAGSDATVMLNGVEVPTFPTFIRNTDAGSVIGAPGLSLPIGTTDEGLPVGFELDGPRGSDRDLLAIGLAMEQLF